MTASVAAAVLPDLRTTVNVPCRHPLTAAGATKQRRGS